jgi:hypothetical protein
MKLKAFLPILIWTALGLIFNFMGGSFRLDKLVGQFGVSAAIIGIVGLIHPKLVGMTSRKKSSLIFFSLMIILVPFAIYLTPPPTPQELMERERDIQTYNKIMQEQQVIADTKAKEEANAKKEAKIAEDVAKIRKDAIAAIDAFHSSGEECNFDKGEFETTSEVNTRIKQCLKQWDEKSVQIVQLVDVSYDSDSKKISFKVNDVINFDDLYNNSDEYQASNAFGATTTVHSNSVFERKLVIKKIPNPLLERKVSIENAKEITSKNYKVLITLKFLPQKDNSFSRTESSFHEPTFSNPYKSSTITSSMLMKAIDYKMYDSASNEVIASGLIK